MKGISPIIASILLLLITISIMGVAAVFFFTTTQDATDDIASNLDRTTENINTRVRIEQIFNDTTNASVNTTIIIRNSGTVAISDVASSLTVLGGNNSVSIAGNFYNASETAPSTGNRFTSSLQAGGIIKYVTSSSTAICDGDYRIRVYHPGLTPASKTC